MNKYDLIFGNVEKEHIKNDYVSNHLSIREIKEKYDIKSSEWVQKVLSGVTRTLSESMSIVHEKHPEKFKHTEETKEILREKRLLFMKEHPERTSWRKGNCPSYPEKCFMEFLKHYGYDKKYLIEREKSVFPFYIDFAFTQIKVAIEIDGSQHIKDEKRHSNDLIKNEVLIKNGWKVLRITENAVKKDWESVKNALDNIISSEKQFDSVGIFLSKKTYKKVDRDENGLTEKMINGFIKQRKVKNRPSKEELKTLIKEKSMVKIGKMYGVSDNSVRKWCKKYNLPYTKKDIKNMI